MSEYILLQKLAIVFLTIVLARICKSAPSLNLLSIHSSGTRKITVVLNMAGCLVPIAMAGVLSRLSGAAFNLEMTMFLFAALVIASIIAFGFSTPTSKGIAIDAAVVGCVTGCLVSVMVREPGLLRHCCAFTCATFGVLIGGDLANLRTHLKCSKSPFVVIGGSGWRDAIVVAGVSATIVT